MIPFIDVSKYGKVSSYFIVSLPLNCCCCCDYGCAVPFPVPNIFIYSAVFVLHTFVGFGFAVGQTRTSHSIYNLNSDFIPHRVLQHFSQAKMLSQSGLKFNA